MVSSSLSPSKSLAEDAFLYFTPIWTTLTGLIMVTGIAESWGDIELMTFGVSMAITTLIFALWYVGGSSSSSKLATDNVWIMYTGVAVLAFAMNYIQTPFFFDVLHMRYGFNVTWRIERNPIFLYFLTVPYFATYMAGGCKLYRFITSNNINALPPIVVTFIVATLLAFLETITNANPFSRRLFCYEDDWHALTFGSVCYGISFIFALPCWLHYGGVPENDDNDKNRRTTKRETRGLLMAHAALVFLGVAVLDGIALYFVKNYIAPSFTTVQENAGPFGECLKKEFSFY